MRCIAIVLFFCMNYTNSYSFGIAGDTIFNQTNSKGLKQGYWKKYYPNGNIMYKGYFKNDKPAGELRRYYESGSLKVIMQFNEKGDFASVKMYYENGTLTSDGFYFNSKKDSVWNYYSFYDKKLKSTETYKNGIRQGLTLQYYPGGECFEKTMWNNNLKDGTWEQYFEDGTLRLKATYLKGKLSGNFIVYYSKDKPMVKGKYVNDVREGKWIYYTEDGLVNQEISYIYGQPENEQELTEKQQEFFRNIEKNIGRISEPDINDFVPGYRNNSNEY